MKVEIINNIADKTKKVKKSIIKPRLKYRIKGDTAK